MAYKIKKGLIVGNYRVAGMKHGKVLLDDGDGHIHKVKTADMEQFPPVQPVGVMTIFKVKIDGGRRDVICTLHRAIDLDKGITMPYVAARVGIINLFAAPLENDIEMIPIGMCMSNMTCPNNVDFRVMLEHNGVVASDMVYLYLNDTSDVLRYVDTEVYDDVIHQTRKHFDPKNIRNIGDSLIEFLDNNGWMAEFNNAFNILDLELESPNIQDNESWFYLNQIHHRIERKIGYTVAIHSAIKYNVNMDMRQVFRDSEEFMCIRPNNISSDIFILSYSRGDRLLVIKHDQKQQAYELLNRLK